MNVNKVKDELRRRRIPINKFITDTVGMSVPGFNDALTNLTLSVGKLEIISRALDVPVAYWFDDQSDVVEDFTAPYGNNVIAEIERLRKQIDDLIDDKIRLKAEIEKMKKK